MKPILITFGLVAMISLTYFILCRSFERQIWNDLSSLVPSQPLPPVDIQTTYGKVTSWSIQDSEMGHLTLANGDIWRFAFRSHHVLGTLENYSIFTGPPGSFRLRGSYFCCEVQIPDFQMPKDSQEFLAFLQQVHSSCERIP